MPDKPQEGRHLEGKMLPQKRPCTRVRGTENKSWGSILTRQLDAIGRGRCSKSAHLLVVQEQKKIPTKQSQSQYNFDCCFRSENSFSLGLDTGLDLYPERESWLTAVFSPKPEIQTLCHFNFYLNSMIYIFLNDHKSQVQPPPPYPILFALADAGSPAPYPKASH